MAQSLDETKEPNELLQTKLFAPTWRREMVRRPELTGLLRAGPERKLTIVTAPAGFGKTTLIAEWLDEWPEARKAVGWVSLDPSDNEPRTFWRYIIAAIQKTDPEIGKRAMAAIISDEPRPYEPIVTGLINDVASSAEPIVLVLDDFHVIDARAILQALEFLVDHQPPNLHIVIVSRSDPQLPMARLRARGESFDIRAADLRFTAPEARTLLNETMGLDLNDSDVATLESRTEGWAAGLQLAALSLRGRRDASDFIRSFAGDDRYIVDYLIEEVLNRQSEEIRDFLLATSILERLCGPLCDAVTGRHDGQAILQRLEETNVFLVPLDERRHWYRYHHLFADVVRAHAAQSQPDCMSGYHRRASVWYERHREPAEAIRHAFAASDLERAADLIELAWRPMDRVRQIAPWLAWTSDLPEELIRRRPVLALGYAWALLEMGDLETGSNWLGVAAGHLDDVEDPGASAVESPTSIRIADQDEARYLRGSIAAARAFHAMTQDDTTAAREWARQSLDHIPRTEHYRRSSPAALLALASWKEGDLDEAARSLTEALEGALAIGNARFVVSGSYILGEILRGQGQLDSARRVYDEAVRFVAGQPMESALSGADIHTGLAELHLLRDDRDAANLELDRSLKSGEQAGLPHWRHRWLVASSSYQAAMGDPNKAVDDLDQAARHFTRGPVPDVRPIRAIKMRVLIRLGRLDEAETIARAMNLSLEDDAEFMLEYAHLSFARLVIARRRTGSKGGSQRALFGLLDRLRRAAIDRVASQIEILLTTALAYDAFDDKGNAILSLEKAYELARPLNYVQPFLSEGEPMQALVRAALSGSAGGRERWIWPAFCEKLDATRERHRHGAGQLVEPLTDREHEVIQLVAAGLRNREVAERLFIAEATVKRHIANAYGKLGVSSRTEAVARANELNLL